MKEWVTTTDRLLISAVLNMTTVLQKLFIPMVSGPAEPPRNKVTVVGVGQVGMACAVSILLRVRFTNLCQNNWLKKTSSQSSTK